MKLITQRDLIKGVYERWVHRYPIDSRYYEDKKPITAALSKLDLSTVSAKEVDCLVAEGEQNEMVKKLY